MPSGAEAQERDCQPPGITPPCWSNPAATIAYINVFPSGFAFYFNVNTVNPCTNGGQFYVPWSGAAAQQIYSAVLASYEYGDLLRPYVVSCGQGAAFPASDAVVNGVDTRH